MNPSATDGETEAQRGQGIYLRSHRKQQITLTYSLYFQFCVLSHDLWHCSSSIFGCLGPVPTSTLHLSPYPPGGVLFMGKGAR